MSFLSNRKSSSWFNDSCPLFPITGILPSRSRFGTWCRPPKIPDLTGSLVDIPSIASNCGNRVKGEEIDGKQHMSDLIWYRILVATCKQQKKAPFWISKFQKGWDPSTMNEITVFGLGSTKAWLKVLEIQDFCILELMKEIIYKLNMLQKSGHSLETCFQAVALNAFLANLFFWGSRWDPSRAWFQSILSNHPKIPPRQAFTQVNAPSHLETKKRTDQNHAKKGNGFTK